MKAETRKKFRKALAFVLLVAMVFSAMPYLPSGLLKLKAAAWIDGTTVSTAVKGEYYSFDFTAKNNTAGTASKYATPGTYGLMTFATGPSNAASYNGTTYGVQYKTGNNLTFKVPGNCYISVGGDNNSSALITATSSTGAFQNAALSAKTAGHATLANCQDMTTNSVPFLYVGGAGDVTLTITSGSAYIAYICIIPAADNISLTPYTQKTFSLGINGTPVTVTSGATISDNSAVTVGGTGSLELATVDTAVIWADLGGAGAGTLTQAMLSNVSSNVTATVGAGNKITFNYNDTSSNPLSYTIYVKDSSATGTAVANGTPVTYSFKDGSVVSSLYMGAYKLSGGKTIQSLDKLISLTGNNGISFNDATHGIIMKNSDTISVKVAGNATITFELCSYGQAATITPSGMATGAAITPASSSFVGASDGATTTFAYTGAATTLVFTLTSAGSNYLHSMTVTNAAPKAAFKPQTQMPSKSVGFGTEANLDAAAVGQRLIFTQINGQLKTTSSAIDPSVSYYLFPATTESWQLSADVVLTNCSATNYAGIFFGAFNGTYMATVGIRNTTGLRGIYSKSTTDMAGAGGIDAKITAGEKVHFTAQKTSAGFVVSYLTASGATGSLTFPYGSSSYQLFKADGINTSVRYGFAVSNSTAKVTNMKLLSADGTTVLYDQNDCYEPAGTAPVATSVSAQADVSREYITVSWTGSACADDGKYVLEASSDNGATYKTVSSLLETTTYKYAISEASTYKFRVSGILGNSEASRTALVESPSVTVVAALPSSTVTTTAGDKSVNVNWTASEGANRYELYRRSADETSAVMISNSADLSYTDTAVTNDTPYYYYVKAFSADNYSNPSATVFALPTAGHTGAYVNENAAANIFITKKSYDTVYTDKAAIEGVVDRAGSISASVNGTIVSTQTVAANGTFAFDLTLVQGRNDVNIYFTDAQGKVTRKTYNFVYLTNYDIIVDGAYTGTDGAASADVAGVTVYKTVQAAVNSVSSTNTSQVVILIKEGNYDEHLVVNSPNISLIGEDREKVNINFYDSVLSPEGGDTALRCATYIKPTAVNFSAENLTFENTYQYLGDGTKSNESADALRVDAPGSMFVNVKLLGYQDTLDACINTQYYYKCYISGNIDFVYGSAQALFNDCDLVFRYNSLKNSGYLTAPKTDATKYGYIFNNCRILAESGCTGGKYLLARPWGPDAAASFINCYMGSIINTALPYADMSGNLYANARFNEYYTYGPGFLVNPVRRQLSATQAQTMLSAGALGWNPYTMTTSIGTSYAGTTATNTAAKYITAQYVTDTADTSGDNDTGLAKYALEGYADASNVTGGGVLKATASSYYKVSTAAEFLAALSTVKGNAGKSSVIELTADIGLGSKEIGSALTTYSGVIKAHSNQPLLHPTLLNTGVSMLMLEGLSNLTIFSSNGATIKHACVDIKSSSNIIIRNIAFDEIWEWDEDTSGNYDRNDWDYMTVESGSTGIWIDHCTFYKAYDGVVDIKKATEGVNTNVTVSWCSFLPGSKGSFFDDMMNVLENGSAASYPYYNHLKNELGMTAAQIKGYAFAQKKTHLVGASDTEASMAYLTLTLANNYYLGSMDRMPRLRAGSAHVYNCIMDASAIYALRQTIANTEAQSKLVSNGSISTCGASVLVENSYYNGIINAILSGNSSSPAGKINAINSSYYLGGVKTTLAVTDTFNVGAALSTLNAESFKSSLPYSGYNLYNAEDLDTIVQPYTGAGAVTMLTTQWMRTSYNSTVNAGDLFDPNANSGNTGSTGTDSGNTGNTGSTGTDSGNTGSTGSTGTDTGNTGSTGTQNAQQAASAAAATAILNSGSSNVVVDSLIAPELASTLFGNIMDTAKKVTIKIEDTASNLLYSWSFDGSTISNTNVSLDTAITFETAKKDTIAALTGKSDDLYISFAHHGELPGPASIRMYVGDKYNNGDVLYLYYFNEATNKVEIINESGITVNGGYVDYVINHCSVYFLSQNAPAAYASAISGNVTTVSDNVVAADQSSAAAVIVATGDKNSIFALALVLALSAGALFAGFVSKKRKRRNESK